MPEDGVGLDGGESQVGVLGLHHDEFVGEVDFRPVVHDDDFVVRVFLGEEFRQVFGHVLRVIGHDHDDRNGRCAGPFGFAQAVPVGGHAAVA